MEPFRYPATPHDRRHGPRGYANYASYRPWLRDEFAFRCAYCLVREQWGRIRGIFDLDHFVPVSIQSDGDLDYDNLIYACCTCNLAKGNARVADPAKVLLDSSVSVLPTGHIRGHTEDARRLIKALALNAPASVEFRRLWIDVIALARRYDLLLYKRLLSYPDDLPDLSRLRPPGGNSRPEGVEQSHFVRRERGESELNW